MSNITWIEQDGKQFFAVAEIKVTRERFREPKNIPQLIESLRTFGQLQPIILEPDGELVDGMRRFTATKAAGLPLIWGVLRQDVDELLARQLELETNIQRDDMHWTERVKAIAEIDRLRRIKDPNWSQSQTAAVVSTEQSRVAEAIKLTKMIELFPEIADAKSIHQAQSWSQAKAAQVLRVREVKDSGDTYKPIEERIILGDSVEVIKTVPEGQFNLILTDPPFGIGYDTRKAGTEGSMSAYKDDEESYRRILSMAPDLYRVLKRDGWLVWFLGPTWYERAKNVFREAGFTVDEIPIIWYRRGGRAYTTRPDRYFGRIYDMALHCIKGDPQMVGKRSQPNVIEAAPVEGAERELLVERPVELYQELIRRLTVEGETVADFFVGSGSVPAAAASLKRQFFGVELSAERRAYAIKKIAAYTADANG